MGYRTIPLNALAAGKATSQLLWRIVRGNFVTHQSRLLDLESSTNVVPTGFILAYAAAGAPTGFLLCDGSAVDASAYADLFAIMGFTYGNPGGGRFNLPDFRGRTIIGNGTGASLSARAVGDSGGFETETLSTAELPSHTHAITDPGHLHAGIESIGGAVGYFHESVLNKDPVTPTYTSLSAVTGISLANSGSGGSHNNMQPSTVISFVIKT
jgi:microcystin-dependent protein